MNGKQGGRDHCSLRISQECLIYYPRKKGTKTSENRQKSSSSPAKMLPKLPDFQREAPELTKWRQSAGGMSARSTPRMALIDDAKWAGRKIL